MNCAEKISYIIDKMLVIGVEDSEQFLQYVIDIMQMTDTELTEQIDILEGVV